MQRSQFILSSNGLDCHIQYTLDRVMVCTSIGRWSKWWVPKTGKHMRKDSRTLLISTHWRLMRLGLRISRQYCELPEPTTEKV